MSDNITVSEVAFHPWEVLIPELRRHALSYCDKGSLLNYSQCSKRSNTEIQEYDTKAPLSVEVKDLRDGQSGVMVKLEYAKMLDPNCREWIGSFTIDHVEALIEIKTDRGDVDQAEIARNELATLRDKRGIGAEHHEELILIAARLLNIDDIQLNELQNNWDKDVVDQVERDVANVIFARIARNELSTRRKVRIERENNRRKIEISFVAVGPNQHKMILNRPSDMEDGILEGNAVDAAYEYLAKRFEKKKNGYVHGIRMDVKKWPTKFMESKTIKKGVQAWKVAMHQTIYEEFMEHMRMNTNQKYVGINQGDGMGYNFKIPTDIFTVFQYYDIVLIQTSCQFADDNILQKSLASLSIPADAVTDMAIHAKIRQLIDSTTDTNIWIFRSSKFSPGRGDFDKTVVLEDLPCQPEVAQGVSNYKLRRNDGGIVVVDFIGGDCKIVSKKIRRNYY